MEEQKFIAVSETEYNSYKHGEYERKIREWLKSKDWYESYERNVIECFKDIRLSVKYLEECDGINTIFSAFPFARTKEGTLFWVKKYVEFTKWYEEE